MFWKKNMQMHKITYFIVYTPHVEMPRDIWFILWASWNEMASLHLCAPRENKAISAKSQSSTQSYIKVPFCRTLKFQNLKFSQVMRIVFWNKAMNKIDIFRFTYVTQLRILKCIETQISVYFSQNGTLKNRILYQN